jgi:hypothetical protein
VLTAYLDESGQEQNDWAFVCGFIGTDEAWAKFPSLWAKAIGPQRTHLHMTNIRFIKQAEKRMLARAADIPKKCGLLPLIAGVRLKDYTDMLKVEGDSLKYAAYVVCCQAAAASAMKLTPSNDRVELVLERQDRYMNFAIAAFERMSKTYEAPEFLMADGKTSKLASWRFVSKSYTCLCEPADYLAYACLQTSRNSKSLKSQWTRPILSAQANDGAGVAFKPDQIRNFIIGSKAAHIRETIQLVKQIIIDAEAKHKAENAVAPQ